MTGYYLGIEVQVVGEVKDGWVEARWANGKVYRHWAEQVEDAPWSRRPVLGVR